ncbi:MAG: EAL domain-containing protein [Desulfuromonas sp.]|nr:EAL domain-containing protein [Desulfuromonas sp.]
MKSTPIAIKTLIENRSVTSHYQPIINLHSREVIGCEALCRGISPEAKLIPPLPMFAAAAQAGLSLELDRLCRQRILNETLEDFIGNDKLVFINFDICILAEERAEPGWLAQAIRASDYDFNDIAIEIVESELKNIEPLITFVEYYRALGCLIVIDDYGTSHSNCERIASIKPDIIKIDKGLISGIADDYYKQSIVAAVIQIGRKIGSLVLAEGVEEIRDVLHCHRAGVDLMQGYIFSRPIPHDQVMERIELIESKILRHISLNFENHLKRESLERVEMQQTAEKIVNSLRVDITEGIENVLRKILPKYRDIHCLFTLDMAGRQVGDTVFDNVILDAIRHPLFKPATDGADHSLKDYYYLLRHSVGNFYLTEPYISKATGCLCRTFSTHFRTSEEKRLILCIDFGEPGEIQRVTPGLCWGA